MDDERPHGRHAAIGVICGVGVILWMTFSNLKIGDQTLWPDSWASLRSPLHGFLTIVVGTCVVLAVGVAASVFRGVDPPQAESRGA